MIITTQKPIDEIMEFISPYTKVMIAGCDGCTQPPRGLREAKTLSQLLELAGKLKGENFEFKVTTVAKQCDNYLSASILKPQLDGTEVILSLACGIGIQTLADVFPGVPIFPAQNSHFMGAEEREADILEVRCAGCGDCLLAETGGICPIARCSKSLLSGACGGSKDAMCELSPDRDCAWCLIYDRLKAQNKLHLLEKTRPPRDYQLSGWRVTT